MEEELGRVEIFCLFKVKQQAEQHALQTASKPRSHKVRLYHSSFLPSQAVPSSRAVVLNLFCTTERFHVGHNMTEGAGLITRK